MSYKNLEDQFLQNIDKIYGKFSLMDGSTDQPYLEFKPNDPNADSTANDQIGSDNASVDRDIIRIKGFLNSPIGKQYSSMQNTLQTFNTFSETRLINPDYILGNLDDNVNVPLKRPFSSQLDVSLTGDNPSPGSAGVGKVGRLQVETNSSAQARVLQSPDFRGLLMTLLSSSKLGSIIGNTFSLAEGTLDVDQRPELDINGQLYSVMLWNGSIQSNFANTIGNFISNTEQQAVANFIDPIKSVIQLPNFTNIVAPQNNALSSVFNSTLGGQFLSTVSQITQQLATVAASNIVTKTVSSLPPVVRALVNTATNLSSNPFPGMKDGYEQVYFIQDLNPDNDLGYITIDARNSGMYRGFPSPVPTQVLSTGVSSLPAVSVTADQPSFMRLPSRDLETQYTSDRMAEIRSAIDNQKNYELIMDNPQVLTNLTNDPHGIRSRLGFIGGIDPNTRGNGNNLPDKMNSVAYSNYISALPKRQYYIQDTTKSAVGYFHDKMNESGRVSPLTDVGVSDYINFQFVNLSGSNRKKVVLRAMITDLSETSSPVYNDTPYIGRVERNIVFAGVKRELRIEFRIHTFSPSELTNVWDKINFLTGLTFPKQYSTDGYMIPPLVGLTIGDLYIGQPGYISELSNTIEQDTSWETEADYQVPHGIKISMGFSLIEKKIMNGSSAFYGFGVK